MPYAIAHDQEGAGLRDYFSIVASPQPPSLGWVFLLVVGFVLGVTLTLAVRR
jgi:hypothetical protein